LGDLAVEKLVVLRFGSGSFETGFPVTLQIGEENRRPASEVMAALPPAPDLLLQFHHWQAIYRSLDFSTRPIGLPKSSPSPPSREACHHAAAQLHDRLNAWLHSASFRPIREKWLEKLQPDETIRVILQTQNLQLQKLPWHLWEVMESYPKAEIALSAATYEQVNCSITARETIKILALLGDSTGIDVQADRALLSQLPDARVHFLVEPDRQELADQLWDQQWNILFFAGHSASRSANHDWVATNEGDMRSDAPKTGHFYINATESLTIRQMKYALKKAVDRGLKLAIFNSCDGLGLAQEFADLQIPQLVVMREPVPDRIAQEFLKYFLAAFSGGQSLYLAVREARERLQGLEGQFPCATWLPVIYQNPAEVPPTWQQLLGREARPNDLRQQPQPLAASPRTQTRNWIGLLLGSAAITTLTMGIRHLGVLQPLELQAFDQLLQLRPDEKPDDRLLIVTVTEEDVQSQAQEPRRGSLSDRSLSQLLKMLEAAQPQLIGLDIYRDHPTSPDLPELTEQLQQSDRLIAVCKVSDAAAGRVGVAPPPEVPIDRLGFSDLVLDPDNVVRRHLLALKPPPSSSCAADYAFSTQIALRYLAAQNIQLHFTPDGSWQLGQLQFRPLEAHTGSYQGIDAWGHQILLNYRVHRSPRDIAPQVTLTQVLTEQVDANAIKNRIVLIGTTAESFQDYSFTPYRTSQGTMQKIPGVILQAQMISQLISAALDERSLLWTWVLWQETLWVGGWSLMGGLLAWSFRRLVAWGIAVGVAMISLTGICVLVLMQWGGWLPLVPAVIALIGNSVYMVIRSSSAQRQIVPSSIPD
jgi:CHASE2 domain-containing sensor protein